MSRPLRDLPPAPAGEEERGPSEAPAALWVSLPTLLQDWRGAFARAIRYLEALRFDEPSRKDVAARAVLSAAADSTRTAERGLHAAVLDAERREIIPGDVDERERDARYLEWRLRRATGRPAADLPLLPPLERASMPPHHIGRRGIRRRLHSARSEDPWTGPASGIGPHVPRSSRARRLRMRWVRVAFFRRALLLLLVSIPTVIASGFMLQVLPQQGRTYLEVAIVVVFGILFGWISIGFWTALAGFGILLARRDRFRVTAALDEAPADLDPRARTAILMTIREEPVEEVFARLEAMYRSLAATGHLESFEFHVLSDTHDPDTWVREEEAWLEWCRAVDGFGRIFYRRRRVHVKRKSGNIADFCRRFGARYRYMITLDADSMMTGDTLVKLVRLMEERPEVGLVQTMPVPIHARSLYARIQQFANRVYGPLFATGMHYWQLGDAQYWGHNAILRVEPFMLHCSLPRLPGKPPRGGEILSHDFVEAAMLGRAGYSIWLAYDLGGSWEELPSSLLEDLQRDRRWCQGNFQHLRLVQVEGLFHFHRVLFVNGVLAYGSALLWFAFLSLSTTEAILQVITVPEYFPDEPSLFPQWPIWRPDWAIALMTVTLAILFLPKVLSALVIMVRGDGARAFGGGFRFLVSIVLEFLASSLFAPIRMLFHTKFVLTNLLGRVVQWRSPPRGISETPWAEAVRRHGGATLLATAWGAGVYWLNPDYFWWLTPIIGALLVSVPVSVWMSRVRLGDLSRAAGLFLTPEQVGPPPELRDLARTVEANNARLEALPPLEQAGFARAIVDPFVNALHRAGLRGPRTRRPTIGAARRKLVERVLEGGPSALGAREKTQVLLDAECVAELHESVWRLPSMERARRWGRPGASADEVP